MSSSNEVLGDCLHCGTPLVRKGKRGPLPKYCSASCRALKYKETEGHAEWERGKREKVVKDNLEKYPIAICAYCGGDTHRSVTGAPRTYCSKRCSDSAGYRRRRATQPRCNIPGCDRPSHSQGMCGSHYSSWWNDENPERKLRLRGGYEARLESQTVEAIPREAVFERDGWVCHLCGEPIPRDAAWPDVLSAQVDHVVPLAKGGDHSWGNVAAAHFKCNAAKRDRLSLATVPV